MNPCLNNAKYRGKSVDDGRWIYGSLINLDCSGAAIAEKGDSVFVSERDTEGGSICQYVEYLELVIPKTVGQFSNNSDIYEGDLLQNESGRICRAYFNVVCGCWDATPVHAPQSSNSDGFWFIDWNRLKKVGNIHDNPELLENT